MSAAVSIPWSLVLADVSAGLNDVNTSASAGASQLHQPRSGSLSESRSSGAGGAGSGSSLDAPAPEQDPAPPSMDMGEKKLPNVADWKGTLDLVTGMAGVAAGQRSDLREHTEAQQCALEILRRELNEIQRRLRTSEQRVQELQAQADGQLQKLQADLDAQVQEAQADTETRLRVVRARTAGLIRASEERVRAAELRAQKAQEWLQRVDAAAKNLLLNGHMSRAGNRSDR